MEKRQYDIALSFAGEDRQYAERLAELLTADGYSVFYDEYERAELWGKDLYTHLSSVYKDQADYCVMFLSKYYAQALWANHELQNAQARAFQENQEYILPIRLDDTEIPGILPTVGYLDLREMTIENIYQKLVKKLSGTTVQNDLSETEAYPRDVNAYNDVNAYYNRGVAYRRIGDFNLAIEDFNEVIKLKPDYVDAYNYRGITYRDKGDNDRAIKDFNKTIELKPDVADAYNHRGVAYGNKGKYNHAIADFNKAIELEPGAVNAYNHRGVTYRDKVIMTVLW